MIWNSNSEKQTTKLLDYSQQKARLGDEAVCLTKEDFCRDFKGKRSSKSLTFRPLDKPGLLDNFSPLPLELYLAPLDSERFNRRLPDRTMGFKAPNTRSTRETATGQRRLATFVRQRTAPPSLARYRAAPDSLINFTLRRELVKRNAPPMVTRSSYDSLQMSVEKNAKKTDQILADMPLKRSLNCLSSLTQVSELRKVKSAEMVKREPGSDRVHRVNSARSADSAQSNESTSQLRSFLRQRRSGTESLLNEAVSTLRRSNSVKHHGDEERRLPERRPSLKRNGSISSWANMSWSSLPNDDACQAHAFVTGSRIRKHKTFDLSNCVLLIPTTPSKPFTQAIAA